MTTPQLEERVKRLILVGLVLIGLGLVWPRHTPSGDSPIHSTPSALATLTSSMDKHAARAANIGALQHYSELFRRPNRAVMIWPYLGDESKVRLNIVIPVIRKGTVTDINSEDSLKAIKRGALAAEDDLFLMRRMSGCTPEEAKQVVVYVFAVHRAHNIEGTEIACARPTNLSADFDKESKQQREERYRDFESAPLVK